MIEIVSIKFKNRGKTYSFDPRGLQISTGDKLVVETAKGLELADCTQGNHTVEESSLVLPLRPVVRLATRDDLRVAEINVRREAEAMGICRQKIAEHGLDMKLVDAECSFEGNKITFFFTSDGRVDFRELVKELASIFRARIELRQIGVRDEAKMVGGIAVCGRPYCCGAFLDDFRPVSTKMAKIQSLSLNPAKISGSCGRLMCCLRYEQEAYEDLIKSVPKQGAFVETKDGYGTAVQVNLLRQCVKVRLDGDNDDTLHLYKANELAAVPGGRPRDGEEPPHVLNYVPEPEEEPTPEVPEAWTMPLLYGAEAGEPETEPAPAEPQEPERKALNRRRSRNKPGEKQAAAVKPEKLPEKPIVKVEKLEKPGKPEKAPGVKPAGKKDRKKKPQAVKPQPEEKKPVPVEKKEGGRHGKTTVKPVKLEQKPQSGEQAEAPKKQGGARRHHRGGGRRKNPPAEQ